MANNYNKMNADTAAQPSGSDPLGNIGCGAAGEPARRKMRRLTIPCIAAVVVLMVCGIAVPLHFHLRDSSSSSSGGEIQPTQAIVMTCRLTQYPSLCIDSLASFPGALSAKKSDLVRISVNMTLQHVQRAHSGISVLTGKSVGGGIAQQAIDDCGELLEDSMDQLSRSISAASSHGSADVMTWLSAALTNQDTCREGIGEGVQGEVRDRIQAELSRLEEITSNSLAMFAVASGGRDFSGVPIQNRRLLSDSFREGEAGIHVEEDGFPAWLNGVDRKLLTMEMKDVEATIRVASDGSGTYRTIQEAVDAVPEQSNTRTVIYVKAGRYQENIKVGRKKWNVMVVGDGKASTVISGSRSVQGGYTTFHTATFAATGFGFIARDITFENTAGPDKHQAVALRVGGDHAVVYRCSIISYQDTLYVHSQRQFFRECDIYGTVDFIFGNADVVIQKSNIVARKPMSNQKNTITAQNRKDPNQNTGISIHDCQILASQDLNSVKSGVPTYLGRPWKMYSRVVFMLSYMGDHINPQGWLPWSGNFALDTLFYGEYMNYGPGAAIGKRVQWRGYRVITSAEEANKFTVGQFIYGTSWLPSTGVAYIAGLS